VRKKERGERGEVGEAGPDNRLLQDRIAVITGGAAGIGLATAELFARHRAKVYVADIDGEGAKAAARGIGEDGGAAIQISVDVRQADDVARLRAQVLRDHGRLDVLVNNVGHWLAVKEFTEGDHVHWQSLYEINLLHVFALTYAFLPDMLERGRGAIVNVSSIEGVRAYPPDPVYGAFKAAVIHFTRSLGVDVAGRGVRVNGIAPDMTNTVQSNFVEWDPPGSELRWPSWVPLGRMGVPEDQARVVLFLASDLADFVVGQTINTDGGTGAAGGWYPSDRRPGRRWTNRPAEA
jgi:NAD(P)-dependent dehydrogenase (short-subunit alcohol dehydrogenase family)